MDIQNKDRGKTLRLLGDTGRGAAIVFLRGASVISKAVEILAKDFRVVSFTVTGTAAADELAGALAGLGISEAGLVGSGAVASAALGFALAQPALVQSLALLAPPALDAALTGRLPELKAPVLALFGTRDSARAPDAARIFCGAIPNCSLMYVYDAVRDLDDERPEAVATALAAFALKREKFLVTGKSSQLYP
jgi:pimeloyl-ACP methyl ester carboxylesterase